MPRAELPHPGTSALAITIAESDLVRSTNDLFKEYSIGRVQKVNNGIVKVEFNPSVFMEPPYRLTSGDR
jgi:hypothetical protein